MRNIISLGVLTILLSLPLLGCEGKINNAKTETIKIYGNCGMCKETIEEAAYVKKEAKALWNVDSKMAVITYDSTKTNLNSILKSIAQAGYDSDFFLAPENAYKNLHQCCKYDRKSKLISATESKTAEQKEDNGVSNQVVQKNNQMKPIFDLYFELKDALVKSDGTAASSKGKSLLTAINNVDMGELSPEMHSVWMNVLEDLKKDCSAISGTVNIEQIRSKFIRMSQNMYALMKVAKYDEKIYYQFCPMANNGKGANWLSKESAIKNPYYGSQMMTCGSTKETIE